MSDSYSVGEGSVTRTGMNTATIVAVLQLVGVVTGGLINLVALVLAYVWKNDRETPAWAVTHHRFHIRTFWYSVLFVIVGWATVIIGIGILILAAVGLYVAVRTFLALARATRREPVPNPEALIW